MLFTIAVIETYKHASVKVFVYMQSCRFLETAHVDWDATLRVSTQICGNWPKSLVFESNTADLSKSLEIETNATDFRRRWGTVYFEAPSPKTTVNWPKSYTATIHVKWRILDIYKCHCRLATLSRRQKPTLPGRRYRSMSPAGPQSLQFYNEVMKWWPSANNFQCISDFLQNTNAAHTCVLCKDDNAHLKYTNTFNAIKRQLQDIYF